MYSNLNLIPKQVYFQDCAPCTIAFHAGCRVEQPHADKKQRDEGTSANTSSGAASFLADSLEIQTLIQLTLNYTCSDLLIAAQIIIIFSALHAMYEVQDDEDSPNLSSQQ